MCVDYRDLNQASPKENFPLPHIDTLVDNTVTNVVFSLMDGFSGYNQIKMANEDKLKTAFTHWGTFVYDVMQFGLKNAEATYQRAMMDPIKYIFEKPALTGKIARWQITQQELMDAKFLDEDVMVINEGSLYRWKLYFDGAANTSGSEIGAVLISPKGQQSPIVVKLGFDCTNNMTELTESQHTTYALKCMSIEAELDGKPWYYDIKHFVQHYAEDANQLIDEMYLRLTGTHANGPFLAKKIMRVGYYWLTMESSCIKHGMDVIGAITPKPSNGHDLWVEACSFKNVTQAKVTRFVKNNIIYRYGMPKMIITDNALNLNNQMTDQLCQQFNSAPYRPKMNGVFEVANKNVKRILNKMTETYKDWHEQLP
uniref:Reverse transcriptase domain-containing protein n=1 Tax=Fagus sylvatica TaxID=28930 RepID=A0A2N9HCY0_FAGSY